MIFSKRFKFKAKVPDLLKYIGKTVLIDGKKIVINRIVGNMTKKAFYEINGEYLMNMLRFHAQMEGDKSITEEQFKAFEEIKMDIEQSAPKKTVLDQLPKLVADEKGMRLEKETPNGQDKIH